METASLENVDKAFSSKIGNAGGYIQAHVMITFSIRTQCSSLVCYSMEKGSATVRITTKSTQLSKESMAFREYYDKVQAYL